MRHDDFDSVDFHEDGGRYLESRDIQEIKEAELLTSFMTLHKEVN